MLELTFGRPGQGQQIAAIRELSSRDLVFNSDDVTVITGCSNEEVEDLLRSLVETGFLSIIHIGPKIYYSRSVPIDSKIIMEDDPFHPEENICLILNEFADLESEIEKLGAAVHQKEAELNYLENLTEKWREATVEVFQEIRGKWSQPLSLEQLAVQAGFNPDDLGIDFDEIDTTSNTPHESDEWNQ